MTIHIQMLQDIATYARAMADSMARRCCHLIAAL